MGKRKHSLPPQFNTDGSRVHKVAGAGGPSLNENADDGFNLTMDDAEGLSTKPAPTGTVHALPSQQSRTYTPAPRYERQFDFSATDMTAKTSQLRRKDEAKTVLRTPRVYYSPKVWDTLWTLITVCDQEVGWLGYVETTDLGNYLITDIYIPEQTVSSAETDIDPDAMAALAMQLLGEGKDPGKLFYWGHSHVNMGVSPSGQDERQIDEYLNDCPLFIRGIYNKKGESKVDVFDRETGVVHQCVPNRLYSPGLTAEEQAALKEHLKANVKSWSQRRGAGGYNYAAWMGH